jgi:putative ABC transport system substrate-binding protein
MTEVRNQGSGISRNGTRDVLPVSPALLVGGLLPSWLNLITGLRVLISVCCALFFALCSSASGQPKGKIPHIGFVTSFGAPSEYQIKAFREGLKDHGYIEGENILIDYRYPEGTRDRAPEFVAEFIKRKVDLIIATDPTAIRAAQEATKTIPIVMLTNQDPVATGLVSSLAKPGGNITGVTRLARELSGKRLELLKEVAPQVSRVGVLWVRPTSSGFGTGTQNYERAANTLKIRLESLPVSRPDPDLAGAFQAATKAHVSALVVVTHAVLSPHKRGIAELALRNKLPSMTETQNYAEDGCLMSYSASDAESFKRAAAFVDKILKGTRPADLPVEQPTKFDFVVNLKAAKQLGLTIPPNVLARADKVIK